MPGNPGKSLFADDFLDEAPATADAFLDQPKGGFFSSLGKSLANTAGTLERNILNTAIGAGNLLPGPKTPYVSEAEAPYAAYKEVPEDSLGSTTGKLLGRLPAEILSAAAPASEVSTGLRALGSGARLASIGGATATGALAGLRQSPQEAITQAGEFGIGQAAAELIPGGTVPRTLMRMAAQAAVPVAGAVYRQGTEALKAPETWLQAGIQAGMQGIQDRGALRRLFQRSVSEVPTAAPIETEVLPPEGQQLALPGPTTAPSGRYWNQLEWPHGEARTYSRSGEPIILGAADEALGPANPFEGRPVTDAELISRNAAQTETPQYQGAETGPKRPLLRKGKAAGTTPESSIPDADQLAKLQQALTDKRSELHLAKTAVKFDPEAASEIPGLEREVSAIEGQLRRLRPGESGAVPRSVLNTLGSGAGGVLYGYATGSDEQDREERALRMGLLGAAAGAGISALPSGRSILRRAAQYRTEAGQQTTGNRIANTIVNWTRLGEEAPAVTALQRGKGFANTRSDAINAALKQISPELSAKVDADPAMQGALKRFVASRGTPADEAALRSVVPSEYADAITTAHRVQREVQAEGAKADPEYAQMYRDTSGTYTRRAYSIFTDPKNWKVDKGAFDTVVKEMQASRPGVDRSTLERELNQTLADYQTKGDYIPDQAGKRISQSLYAKLEKLSPAYKKLLGEVTNPGQRQILTAQKLLGSAETFKAINELDTAMRPDGRKMVVSPSELDAMRKSGADTGDYAPIPDTAGLGKLAGKYAPVSVIREIDRQRNVAERFFQSAPLRTANSIQKAVVTVGNWATHARQWAQTPFMVLASRGNPTMIREAWGALRDKANPLWKELRENNIVGANFSHNEFMRTAHKLGTRDGLLKKAWGGIKDLYGLPDDIVRALSYVSAKKRFGGDAAKATEFVNKFTMNYGAQSRGVNLARSIPVVNPFVSFISEMARVSKNLANEAVHGQTIADKAWALSALGGMWAIPTAISAASKAAMTPAERKEADQMEKLMPSWQRAQGKVFLGRNQIGGLDWIGLNAITPTGDTQGMARLLAQGDWAGFLKENPFVGLHKSPILSALLDVTQGEHHFTGQKLDTQGKIARAMEPILPPWAGFTTPEGQRWGGYEGQRISDMIRNGERVNAKTGQIDTPERAAMRNLLGINIQSSQREKLLRSAAYERDTNLREADAEMKRKMRAARSEPERRAILQRAKEKKQEAVLEFQQKIATR